MSDTATTDDAAEFLAIVRANLPAIEANLALYFTREIEAMAACGVGPAHLARTAHLVAASFLVRAFGARAAGRMLQKTASEIRRAERDSRNQHGTTPSAH